jgi:hypothetical protein
MLIEEIEMGSSEDRTPRECPKGHNIDPNWVECPYCKAEERARQKSSPPEAGAAPDDRRTRVGEVQEMEDRRQTRTMSVGGERRAEGHLGVGDTRRIVGFIITYSWKPQGIAFFVREGKNFIGSGKVTSDASHPDCDVIIREDQRMSSEHALILCRRGQFEIMDQASSNGTLLNGKSLLANQSVELSNGALIETGDTLWRFVMVEPPPLTQRASGQTPPAEEETVAIPSGGERDQTTVR